MKLNALEVYKNGRMLNSMCVYSLTSTGLKVRSFFNNLLPKENVGALQVMHIKYKKCIYCIVYDGDTFYGINLSTEEKIESYSL